MHKRQEALENARGINDLALLLQIDGVCLLTDFSSRDDLIVRGILLLP